MKALITPNENTIININGVVLARFDPGDPVRTLTISVEADTSYTYSGSQAHEVWSLIGHAAIDQSNLIIAYAEGRGVLVNIDMVSVFSWLGNLNLKMQVGARSYKIVGGLASELWAALKGVKEHV